MSKFIKITWLAVALVFLSCANEKEEKQEEAVVINPNEKVIVIDAAHGGVDHGSTVKKVIEKEITLKIAQKIKELNTDENLKILFTRHDDSFVSLSDRVMMINDQAPYLLLSLHINVSNNPEDTGAEFYYYKGNYEKESLAMAEKFQEYFEAETPVVKEGTFYVLKQAQVPALHLYLGYLSNEKDYKKLISEYGQKTLAEAILNSLKAI
jgi:N-acetylmuramoyl-L-alanine amidase